MLRLLLWLQQYNYYYIVRVTQSGRTYRLKFSMQNGGLLELLMSCGPANPIMAAFKWKVGEYSSYFSCEGGCLSWSSVYTRILKKQALMPEKGGLNRKARSKQEKSLSFSLSLYRLPAEGVARIKGVFPPQRARLEVDLPT